ncbi:Methylcrotonyl-CoA carboxylase carboxyl transferase subunit [Geobacillus proteiniphilus]|uniref:Methylcrotonyl-CoA carboxylase carboxyl transferase subunit n=1 Tax=Geobacillus proteiniphilus TaxID=860353 RepID=A0A1Q5T563_9BACL|nr:Methylcrotonyl-CoA carboxylase carboxyl transferase subunit [Geobacillus proteiniphilus]
MEGGSRTERLRRIGLFAAIKHGIQPCSGRTRGIEQQDPSKQGGETKR